MFKKNLSIFVVALVAVTSISVLTRCGSSSSSSSAGVSVSGLEQIPNSSTMVGTSSTGIVSTGIRNFFPINLQSISGTPPLVTAMSDSNVDTYFFNGKIAEINGYSAGAWTALSTSAKQTLANDFWGTTASSAAGNGGCFMAQGAAEAIARMIDAGGSGCYMKGMAAAAAGVTVDSGAIAQADLFKRTAADKLVKVQVRNMTEQGQTRDMDVFIKVFGTASVSSTIYKARLYFCNSGTQKGYEVITVDEGAGTMVAENYDSQDGAAYSATISAGLKSSGSGIAYDKSKTRTATFNFRSTSNGTQHYVGNVEITGDNKIYAKRYFNSSWGTNKNYSVSSFTGSDFATLRFNEGAFKGYNKDSSNRTHTYTGAAVFQDTYYKNITSDFSSLVADYSFDTDTVFTGVAAPTVTLSDSCTATPDATVTMDFSNATVLAIKTSCDGERFSNYNMCWGSNQQAAQTRLMSIY